MNTTHAETRGPGNFPIHELEQVEYSIQASINYLNALQARRDALTAELERITRPEPTIPMTQAIAFGPAYEYRGATIQCWAAIDVYHNVLRHLWTEFPGQRAAMAAAVSAKGTTRTYVAQAPAELFPHRTSEWANRYSRALVEGWYIDTNLSRKRMRTLLPAAVAAAGLTWGDDVRVYWYAAEVRSPAT